MYWHSTNWDLNFLLIFIFLTACMTLGFSSHHLKASWTVSKFSKSTEPNHLPTPITWSVTILNATAAPESRKCFLKCRFDNFLWEIATKIDVLSLDEISVARSRSYSQMHALCLWRIQCEIHVSLGQLNFYLSSYIVSLLIISWGW